MWNPLSTFYTLELRRCVQCHLLSAYAAQFTTATRHYCPWAHADCVATQLSAFSTQAVWPTKQQWTEYEATHVDLLGLQFFSSSQTSHLRTRLAIGADWRDLRPVELFHTFCNNVGFGAICSIRLQGLWFQQSLCLSLPTVEDERYIVLSLSHGIPRN